MNRWSIWIGSLAIVCFASITSASPTLNYQGRITAGGTNFSGTGFFKFVLVNGGDGGVWSNDGSPGNGEPGSTTAIEVNNGLFTVELGQGMQPIPPVVFHESGLRLRTWFSRDGGVFEQLAPDVDIRPVDFAQFDTGRTLIVDPDGKGDFQDVQEAINCFSSNYLYQTILIMPGYYPIYTPLTFPSNRDDYVICGVGDAQKVTIANTGGPAAILERVRLENVTLGGNPAVSDSLSQPGYQFTCRQCVFYRSSPGGPTLRLETEGNANFIDCEASNNGGGDVLSASGNAQITARNCGFHVWSPMGSALALVSKTRWSSFEHCDFDAWQSGEYSLLVSGGSNDSVRFDRCDFNHGVLFTDSAYGATFTGGELGDGLTIQGGGAQITFNECMIYGNGTGPAATLSDIGNQGNLWFRNCDLHTVSNTTLVVQDVTGEVRIKDCEIHSDGGSAIQVAASAGRNVSRPSLYRSRLLSYRNSDADAVRILNHPSNSLWWVGVNLSDCEVGGERDGIHLEGGTVDTRNSTIRGDRFGCYGSNANVQVLSSGIQGGLALCDSWGDVIDCKIEGRNDATTVQLLRAAPNFRRCNIISTSSDAGVAALRGDDAGGFEISDCQLSCRGSNTMVLASSEGNGVWAQTTDSRIQSLWNSDTAIGSIILIAGDPNGSAGAEYRRCSIEGSGPPGFIDGVRSIGGSCGLVQTSVTASRDAASATNGTIVLEDANLNGQRYGLYVAGSSGATIMRSHVNGSSEGIHSEGGGTLDIHDSGIDAYGSDPDQCRGLCVARPVPSRPVNIIGSTISSSGNGLELVGGTFQIEKCRVFSVFRSAAVICYTNTLASFTGCDFYGMAGGNTNAALVLQGSLSDPPPTPQIWNSTFQPLQEPGSAAYALSVAGGATSATVRLVNSILSTNLAPEITIIAVRTNLVGGNVIP